MPKPEYRFEGKAITFVQPYSAAIAFAGKDIENRSWQTHYRGPVAIHAGGTFDRSLLDKMQAVVRGGPKKPLSDWIERGQRKYRVDAEDPIPTSCVVAIAMLTGCLERSSSTWYVRGNWAWVLEGIVPIEPVPMTGKLGVWDCRFKYRLLKPV